MAGGVPEQFTSYQHIGVAVIVDKSGDILISQRHHGSEHGALWEFPGGKVDPGEGIEDALQRELNEELGICATQMRPLLRIPYCYPEHKVFLDAWRVDEFDGEPIAREGQPLRHVARERLSEFSFPAANSAIIRALMLADYLLITPDPGAESEWPDFLSHLQRRLECTVGRLQVILRAKGLDFEQYRKLARRVAPICREGGVPLQLTAVTDIAAVGLHLTSAQLRASGPAGREKPTPLSASCHDLEELRLAEELGADFALLSPVQATQTHPDAKPLGWKRFQEFTDQISIPVYALGGISPEDLGRSQHHGGQGVAAIRALWALPQA